MKTGVYIIRCKANGKAYVGCAVDIKRRWIHHRNRLRNGLHANRFVQSVWNKYGEESFEFEILKLVSREDLHAEEEAMIGLLNPTMNLQRVGSHSFGFKMPREGVERGAAKRRGKKHSAVSRANMSAAWTPERRAKQAAVMSERARNNPKCLASTERSRGRRRPGHRQGSTCKAGHQREANGKKCKTCLRQAGIAKRAAARAQAGVSPFVTNAERTHCPNGHPLSGDNLRTERRSETTLRRRCLQCVRKRQMKRRAEEANRGR